MEHREGSQLPLQDTGSFADILWNCGYTEIYRVLLSLLSDGADRESGWMTTWKKI